MRLIQLSPGVLSQQNSYLVSIKSDLVNGVAIERLLFGWFLPFTCALHSFRIRSWKSFFRQFKFWSLMQSFVVIGLYIFLGVLSSILLFDAPFRNLTKSLFINTSRIYLNPNLSFQNPFCTFVEKNNIQPPNMPADTRDATAITTYTYGTAGFRMK